MKKIKVDSEFKSLIPALTVEEYGLLEESILSEGCRDSLVVWEGEGILVDGHNRYEICKKHGIAFDVVEKTFGNRYESINWIINNQLGRRNVSEEQRRYLIGKRYQAEKKEHGGDRKSSPHCEDLIRKSHKVAKECGVSHSTVERAGEYASAVDTIAANVGEEVKMDILSGKTKLTMKEAKEIAALPAEEQERAVKEPKKSTAQCVIVESTGLPSYAMRYADMAIMQLERIQRDDPNKDKAIAKVEEWIGQFKGRYMS